MIRIICLLFASTLALGACTERTDRFSTRVKKMEGDAAPPKCGDKKCDPVLEDCGKCPQDCGGPCNGCQVKVTPGCTGCLCEKAVCAKDPTCCTKAWDKVCVQHCKTAPGGCGKIPEAGIPDFNLKPGDKSIYDLSPPQSDGVPDQGKPVCGNNNCEPLGQEDCDTCPADCSKGKKCNGCQPRFKAGCPGCACEKCVCKKHPLCCTMYWHPGCVQACKFSCTPGCGTLTDAGGTEGGTPDQALPDGFGLKCGDKTCVDGKEFCDTCPEDCGKCTGCKAKKKAGCAGCKCEKWVCNLKKSCCDKTGGKWGNECITLCKNSPTGCGVLPDMGVDIGKPDKSIKDLAADLSEDAILAQYDMNYQGDGYNKNLTDWRSNPKYWEAGGGNYSSSKWGTGCNCEVSSPRPPPFIILLALVGLVFLARRRR